jgi:hypothetical protein
MFHLLASGIFGMGFKNLQDFFDPKDSTNGFIHPPIMFPCGRQPHL